MYTLGFRFRPWPDAKAIADGPSILSYVRETASKYGIDRKIRFHHRVVRAEWSTEDARWTVEVERTDTGETLVLTCSFLFVCGGYYRYDEGYTPDFKGTERFTGRIVHPQEWTDDIDYAGKRVVVIGSGATAVTLVPAMAKRAAHVTMLQRSPSYVVSLPGQDPLASRLAPLPSGKARLSDRALEERPADDAGLPAQPAPASSHEGDDQKGPRAAAAGRLRHRHAFQAQLQPLGPTDVPGAGRRSLRGDHRRPRVGGHRSHRHVHGEGAPAGVGR